jgi:hypothetical protein
VSLRNSKVDFKMKKVARSLLLFLALASMPALLLAGQPAAPAAAQSVLPRAAAPDKFAAGAAMVAMAVAPISRGSTRNVQRSVPTSFGSAESAPNRRHRPAARIKQD